MPKSAEEYRQLWNSNSAPLALRPDEPNWTDLHVVNLAPQLTPVMNQLGFVLVAQSDTPEIVLYSARDQRKIFNVATIDELPEAAKTSGISATLDSLTDTTSKVGPNLFDPKDRLYFMKPGDDLVEFTLVCLRHKQVYNSDHWKQQFSLQLETAVKLRDDITEEMAAALVPPNKGLLQIASVDGRTHITNRETSIGSSQLNLKPMLVDGHLVYGQFITFNRKGEYPISEERKPQIVKALVDIIAKSIIYCEEYRNKLLLVYRTATTAGINFNDAFAAREV